MWWGWAAQVVTSGSVVAGDPRQPGITAAHFLSWSPATTSWNLNTGHWEPRTSSAPANLTKAACSRYRATELYRYRSTNDRGFTDFIFNIFKLRVFTGQFSYLHLRENILVSQYFHYLHVLSCYASIFAK